MDNPEVGESYKRKERQKKRRRFFNNDQVTSFLGPCEVGEKQCMEDEEREKKII